MYTYFFKTIYGEFQVSDDDDERSAFILAELKQWNNQPFEQLLNAYNLQENTFIEYSIFKDGEWLHTCRFKMSRDE